MEKQINELEAAKNVFRNMPIQSAVFTINQILEVLHERGAEVRDFDHKERSIYQLQTIGMKTYALFDENSVKDDINEYQDELQQCKETIKDLMIINKKLKLANKEFAERFGKGTIHAK